MAVDVVFRKLVTCALVVSLALLHRVSCASLSNIGGSGGGGGGNSESTVLGSASSSKLVTPTLGSLYRSTRDEYGRNGREERCVSCGGGGAYGERDMRTYGGRPSGIYGYYGGQGSIHDDRNWYYRPESYDGGAYNRGREGYYGRPSYMNMMMGYDDRYMNQMSTVNRYDDRYYPMSTRGYYDNRGGATGDQRMGYYPAGADMGMRTGGGYGYRGNGYDNLDPLYEQYMMAARGGTGGYNRDRYQGTSGGYGGAAAAGGYEDRYRGSHGAYDHKNFRPWDETYSRPSSSSSSAPASGQQQHPSAPSSHPSSSSSSHHYQQPAAPAGHGAPTGPAGTYSSAAIGFHHQSSGPDRPDSRPCCAECCGKGGDHSRYPQSGPTGTGPGYHQSQPHHPQQQQHQQQQQYGGERPDAHGRPGAWNYLSGGSAGGQDYHQGASAAGSASHSQPGQDYGNRGGYQQQQHQQHQQQQRPEVSGGDRQQNTAYGSRPRPSGGLGSTSYLMDRDTGDSVAASQLHSPSDGDAALGGGAPGSSSSSSSNDINNDGNPVVDENPLKSNES
ncbi:hornerin isoform X2 [Ochlerotatus camptorhynchus]|uniref:hornerin isoform X2 n=1 Tax=Ochlerotatus camptorhynchus TaxID=644619 RepID=UPI0031E1F88B